ncbi:MAG: sulfatase [Verrucomicrobiales bacterium]|nr:sulfatase [Verrucomicrobiales bacterium]
MNPSLFPRRDFLQSSTLGLGWLAFSAMANGPSRAVASGRHFPARAKRVIFLSMKGGPSHVDLLDYKPDLIKANGKSAEKFGGAALVGPVHPFSQRGKSGLWMSDLMPHLAKHADDLCIINSMHTDVPNHSPAFVQMHTGSFQFVRPSLGAWTVYGLGTENENLPGFVTLNPPADNGGARNYGSAFLPSITQGTRVGGSQLPALYAAFLKKEQTPGPPMKNISNPSMTKAEQRRQLDLIQGLNREMLRKHKVQPQIEGMIESFELAFRMQSEVPDTLDISKEPESTRKLYGIGEGKDAFARQCLLARRMAEAGVRFIEISSPMGWDHHSLIKEGLSKNCGETDRPIAALLTDLKLRGMLDDTLVVWAGEFGRTPYMQGINGRDHNHKGFSLWMAGGGVKGGMNYGATDEIGYKAVENPMHIHDWHATMLHLLGINHKQLTYNYGGRDFRLTETSGEVAREILA